uniref:Uncharacterized protein n=1 Tax=Catagonus wagneri TaxID=51154 RepID=A0A8C3WBP1_9CETA
AGEGLSPTSLGRPVLPLLRLYLLSGRARPPGGAAEAAVYVGGGVTGQRRKPEPESHFPTSIVDQDEDPGTPKPVSFTVKETVCPRTTQQPLELCDFKEDGVRLGAGGAGGCFPRRNGASLMLARGLQDRLCHF